MTTPEPTDTPTPPHLVDAAAPAMREVFRRVAVGQIGADDAVDILLDWPNRADQLAAERDRAEGIAQAAQDHLRAERDTLRYHLDDEIRGRRNDLCALAEAIGSKAWSASGILRDARTLRAQLDASMDGERYVTGERDHLRAELAKAAGMSATLRAIHVRHDMEWRLQFGDPLSVKSFCLADHQYWPCPTIKALDALGPPPEPSAPPAEGQAW